MIQPCPRCSYQNPQGSAFCAHCSLPLSASAASPGARQAGSQGTGVLAPAQMGSAPKSTEDIGLRHAFAGNGVLLDHFSWLINCEAGHAETLRSSIMSLLSLRNPARMELTMTKLREHGFWSEERDYLKQRRGISTLFVYVAPAGQDLYISRATTVLPSFDPVRIALLVLAAGEVLLGPALAQSMLASAMTPVLITGQVSAFPLLVAVFIGLLFPFSLLFLLIFLVAAFKSWLSEKDFWQYLRRNHLNDFELDDIAVLEHMTDETVRTSVEQLHLDASKIVPPSTGYQRQKTRIRLI